MLVIRVELWSAITGARTEIARMLIDNVGGTKDRGDYRVRTIRGRDERALARHVVQRTGKVLRHERLRLHVWHLVAKALTGVGYGATPSAPAPVAMPPATVSQHGVVGADAVPTSAVR